MNWENLPLLIILLLSIMTNNSSVSIAVLFLLIVKLLGLQTWFPFIESKGISIGIIILTVTVLAPLAQGHLSFQQMASALKTPPSLIAIIIGTFVAWVAGQGVGFMQASPEIVTALISGTIIGVCFFNGLAVGPLIAGGMVALIVGLLNQLKIY